MQLPLVEILTAFGGLASGVGGTVLWRHWLRQKDKRQEKQGDSITDILVRLERVATKLEGLSHLPEVMKDHDKRVTVLEHRQDKTERDVNGIGQKVSAITPNGGIQ